MTSQLKMLLTDLDNLHSSFTHIDTAMNIYMIALSNPNVRQAILETVAQTEGWKFYQRMQELPLLFNGTDPFADVMENLADKEDLLKQNHESRGRALGFFFGSTIVRMVNYIDFYLEEILSTYFGQSKPINGVWETFIKKTGVKLEDCKNGQLVFKLREERHKIEHNRARIDETFLNRLEKKSISHSYKAKDVIVGYDIILLENFQELKEFAEDVDSRILLNLSNNS